MVLTKRKIYLLSALLPLLVMTIVFAIMGYYPFGSATPMAIDFASQYIDLFAYFKRAVLSLDIDSFFYSFSKSLGGDMVGLWGYYLLSPFNFFYALLPFEELRTAAALTILGRYAAMGIAFAHLLIRRYNGMRKRPLLVPIFATVYALNGFAVSYQMNPLWYDALWMLPLIIVALEEVMDNAPKAYRYSLLLATMIMMQYYMAYMMCLFIMLYSLFYASRIYSGETIKEKLKSFFFPIGRLAVYSIIGVGISAVLLWPIVQNLLITKGSYTTPVAFKWEFEFNPLDIVSKLFIAAFNYDQMPSGLPNIYVGAIALMGLILYGTSKAFKKSEKIAVVGIFAVFVLSMAHDFTNKIWHLMQTPAWFYHRFTYLTCFFIVLIAYRTVQSMYSIKKKDVLFIFGVLLMLNGVAFLLPQDFMHWSKQLVSFLFMAAIVVFSYFNQIKKIPAIYAILAITLFELGTNAVMVQSSISYAQAHSFKNAQQVQGEVIDHIRPDAHHFYRIAKMYNRTKNDPFMFDFPGLTNFSSTMEATTLDLFDALGDAGSNAATNYGSGTPFTDALYGVRYFVQMRNLDQSLKNDPNIYSFTRETTRKDLYRYYQAVFETPRLRVYENKNVLPIAFGVSEAFINIPFEQHQPAQNQNRLLQAWLPNDSREYFEQYAFNDIKLENFETDNPNNLSSVSLKRIDTTKVAKITYTFTPQTNEAYYISLPATVNVSKNDIKMTLDGSVFEYYRTFDARQLWNIADNQKGKTVTFEISTTKLDALNIFNVQLWKLNHDMVNEAVASRMKQGLQLNYWNDRTIDGNVDITDDSQYLMTSIPYSPGWKAYIDGVDTPIEKGMTYLMAIPISKGKHHVKLIYTPVGIHIGLIISIVSIMVLFGLTISRRKRND